MGSYSDSNAMHFYNILTVGQFSRKLSQIVLVKGVSEILWLVLLSRFSSCILFMGEHVRDRKTLAMYIAIEFLNI